MKTLKEIKELCKQANACKAQINPLSQFIEEGKEVEAWQILLGNYKWLVNKNILIEEDKKEVCELAGNVGVIYHENGKICVKSIYKDGKLEGVREWFYDNGNIMEKSICKNDKLEGVSEEYYEKGKIESKSIYKNGKLLSIERF